MKSALPGIGGDTGKHLAIIAGESFDTDPDTDSDPEKS
jgi:hypothetical protein